MIRGRHWEMEGGQIMYLLNGRRMWTVVAAVVGMLAGVGSVGAQGKPDVEVTVAGIQYEGTKLWVPATIAVHEGDRVKVNLINKIPGDPAQHGWAIDAFKVVKVVNQGEPTSVEFVADKKGLFPIYCQLHPAHVGGQLIVLGKE
jgi:nitrosocyanin